MSALLVTTFAFVAAPASAQTGPEDPQCMPIYNEYTVGPITVIQSSSCDYEVQYDGEDPLQP